MYVLGGGGGGEPAAVAAHRLVHAYVRERQQERWRWRQHAGRALWPYGGGAEAGAVAGASRAGAAGIS